MKIRTNTIETPETATTADNTDDNAFLDRDTYRRIKKIDRKSMQSFLADIYESGRQKEREEAGVTTDEAAEDTPELDMRVLQQQIKSIKGVGEKRAEEITMYNIKEIVADRWNATQLITDLQGDGFTIVPMGMGFKDMSPPMKELYKLLLEGSFIHGGNPVLRWMAGNVVAEMDAAENIKPSKKKSTEKIDGIVAWIMALDRCIRHEMQGSVYDAPDHDLIVF